MAAGLTWEGSPGWMGYIAQSPNEAAGGYTGSCVKLKQHINLDNFVVADAKLPASLRFVA